MNFCTSTFKSKTFVVIFVAVLAFSLLVQLVGLEYYTRTEILGIDGQTKALMETGSQYDTIILGTSHTNYEGKLHKIDGKVFGYGYPYTYPVVMYAKVKKIIEYAPNVKRIVMEADTHQFFAFSHHNSSTYATYHYLLKNVQGGDATLLYSLDKEIAPGLHKKMIKDWLRKIFKRVKKSVTHEKSEGHTVWSELPESTRTAAAQRRVAYFGFREDDAMNTDSLDYFEKAIRLAREHNIGVVLIRHPLTKEYLRALYPKIQHDVDVYLAKLAQQKGVEVLDLRHVFDANQSLFANQDHLNYEGQEAISKLIAERLRASTPREF